MTKNQKMKRLRAINASKKLRKKERKYMFKSETLARCPRCGITREAGTSLYVSNYQSVCTCNFCLQTYLVTLETEKSTIFDSSKINFCIYCGQRVLGFNYVHNLCNCGREINEVMTRVYLSPTMLKPEVEPSDA